MRLFVLKPHSSAARRATNVVSQRLTARNIPQATRLNQNYQIYLLGHANTNKTLYTLARRIWQSWHVCGSSFYTRSPHWNGNRSIWAHSHYVTTVDVGWFSTESARQISGVPHSWFFVCHFEFSSRDVWISLQRQNENWRLSRRETATEKFYCNLSALESTESFIRELWAFFWNCCDIYSRKTVDLKRQFDVFIYVAYWQTATSVSWFVFVLVRLKVSRAIFQVSFPSRLVYEYVVNICVCYVFSH